MEHYGDSGVTWVGLYTEHADYYENRQTMADCWRPTATCASWRARRRVELVLGAEAWAAGEASTFSDGTSYCYSVRDFLATADGSDYAENVVLDVSDDTCEITATRVDTLWNEDEGDQSTIIRNRRVVKARQTARTYGRPLGPPKTLFSMVIACVTVAVILVFLLGDVRAAAMVSSMVVMVCVITYGSIYWYGDGLNNVSAFFVVIAVGLATDASAHYCHAFQGSEKAAPDDRARDALRKLGPSVFKGGASTGDVADAAVVEDADAPLALAG
ncbi:patched domain-containing protein [Aureococcus anophagefferens]|uniref:Patched domain-containing protein n=1 Tax=Aureococcus anophagefferens TaxID=44056 RepID=A0ABR1FVT9_AURAN